MTVLVLVLGSVGAGTFFAVGASATVPGSPGVTQPGTPIFIEDFSGMDASGAPIRIADYVGGPAANGETYSADPAWSPGASACNGWVMRQSSPLPANGGTPAVTNNDQCARNTGWTLLGNMAVAMGMYQGMTNPAENQILSEYTNSTSGAQVAGLQLQTTNNNSIPTIAGHYYAVSGIFGEVNCGSNNIHALEELALVINGTPTVVGSNLDPCTDPSNQLVTVNGTNVRVAKLQSTAYQVPLTGSTPTLGIRVRNLQANGAGNDVGFDLPQIVDVTPQLDKVFSPTLIAPGGTSTLTITVTNTSELGAKNDWILTDNLPAGMTIASAPRLGGTCKDNPAVGDPYSAIADPGSGSLVVTGGDLPTGQASCTITVDVTATSEGSYTNGPLNVTSNLNPPGSTTLVVRAPRLTLTKALGTPRAGATDQFTVAIRTGSAGGPVVNSTANSTTTGAGSTVTAGTGTTGMYAATADTPYFLTESSANLPAYSTTITCTDSAGLQTGLPNGAAFSGSFPLTPVAGAVISCTLTNNAIPAPNVNISKTVGAVTGPDANGLYTVNYVVTVRNTGNATATYGPLTDTPNFASNLTTTAGSWTGASSGTWNGTGSIVLRGAGTTLAAGATDTYNLSITFKYTNQTQATSCTGPGTGLYNSVSLPAGQEQGTTADNSACTTPPSPPAPALTLKKTVQETTLTGPGQVLHYTFLVTNTGDVTLNPVTVSEVSFSGTGTAPAATCPALAAGELAPGNTLTCTATYLVTQADYDAGVVNNTAKASGTPPTGPLVDSGPSSAQVPGGPTAPALTLVKSAAISTDANNDAKAGVGDKITFSFSVKNTGDVTLTGLSIADTLVAPAGPAVSVTCPVTTLAPGATVVCTSSAYTVTQADVDSGAVRNSATASGTPPTGPPVTSPPSATTTPTPAGASLSLVKSVQETTLTGPGQVLHYSFVVTNTGNVTLNPISISEVTFSGTGIAPAATCPALAAGELAPGKAITCTASYTVTQADYDVGVVNNTAKASGTPPTGPVVDSGPSSAQVPGGPTAPAVTLVKSAAISTDANNDGKAGVGDKITFSFKVTNAGDVTLRGVTVADQLVAPAGPAVTVTCPPGDVAPGDFVTCTSSPYVVTQADVDAGAVRNSATASGTPPTGPPVTSPPSATTTPTPAGASLSLLKSVQETALTGPGQVLHYTFLVTNTGDVTLNPVTVGEVSFSGTGTAPAATCPVLAAGELAPGKATTCTASYLVTQADFDAGVVKNTAKASGTPPTGPVVDSGPSSAQVPGGPTAPAVTLVKSAAISTDANNDAKAGVGDKITFSFKVTNAGDVTLRGVTVADQLVAPAGPAVTVTCPPGDVAPGDFVTCTSSPYVVTQADVDAGAVKNTATASGTPPTGPPVTSPPSATTTSTPSDPGLLLKKRVSSIRDTNGNQVIDLGDEIMWTFAVTNTGDVTLHDVGIDDALLATAGIAVRCPRSTLAPTESMTCVSEGYSITRADVDAGHVANVGLSKGITPTGDPIESPTSDTNTPLDPDGELPFTDGELPFTDTTPGGDVLAFTGTDVGRLVGAALVVLMLGVLLIVASRRRRTNA